MIQDLIFDQLLSWILPKEVKTGCAWLSVVIIIVCVVIIFWPFGSKDLIITGLKEDVEIYDISINKREINISNEMFVNETRSSIFIRAVKDGDVVTVRHQYGTIAEKIDAWHKRNVYIRVGSNNHTIEYK